VTPAFIRDAAKQALDEGRTFYTNARGIAPLREAIRDFHRRTLGADIALERITVPGAAMLAVILALQCVVETGDNIVAVSPVWPNIFQAAEICGAEVRYARLDDDWNASAPRWNLDLEKLFAACDARTKAIFIASPGNPTGWIMSRDEQRAVLDFARARGIAIISDEVYGTLTSRRQRACAVFPADRRARRRGVRGQQLFEALGDDGLAHRLAGASGKSRNADVDDVGRQQHRRDDLRAMGRARGAVAAGDAFRVEMLERCRNGRDVVRKFLDEPKPHPLDRTRRRVLRLPACRRMKDSLGFASDLVRKARVGVAPVPPSHRRKIRARIRSSGYVSRKESSQDDASLSANRRVGPFLPRGMRTWWQRLWRKSECEIQLSEDSGVSCALADETRDPSSGPTRQPQ
jgi:aspartate aminotransferase